MLEIALLIDADNISPKYMGNIMQEVKSPGKVVDVRVCGTEKHLRGWRKLNKEYQFTEVKAPIGKDSTDRVVMREAVDITVHSPELKFFYFVTHDVGFALHIDLLDKLKKQVFIIGTKNAAKSLQKLPNFILIESGKKTSPQPDKIHQAPRLSKPSKSKTINEFLQLLEKAFATLNQDCVSLARLGTILKRIDPTYKVNDYGSAQLSKLLKKLPDFVELKENMARFKEQS